MRKRTSLFLTLISLSLDAGIFACGITKLEPSGVSPGDTVLIKIYADFIGCGSFNRAGFIEPVGCDTLYSESFEIIDNSVAQALIIIPSNIPYYEVEFFICNNEYWENRLNAFLTIGSKTTVYEPELCMVTVDTMNKNMIIWSPPSIENIDSVIIYKEASAVNDFRRIGSATHEALNYIDKNSQPAQNSDRYKIMMKDKSGSATLMSKIHKTIHLTISAGLGGVWNLSWDHYEGFQYSSYKILRGTSDGNLTEIAERPENTYTYTDLQPPVETAYYQIEVINPNPCSTTNFKSTDKIYNSTRSNIVNNNLSNVMDNIPESNIIIWPNPADNIIYVNPASFQGITELSILTVDGKLVIHKFIDELNPVIDINTLKNGIYIVQLREDNKTINRKLIKQ